MKTIKSVLVVAIFLITSISFAQPGGKQRGGKPGPPPIPNTEQIKEMVGHLSKEISMTKEQEDKILELYIKHFELVKEKTSENKHPKREEMEELRTAFEKQVKAELTEEQISRYEVFLEKRKSKHKRRQ